MTLQFFTTLKNMRTLIKNNTYRDCSADELQRIYSYLEDQMLMHEEEMTMAEADAAWKGLDLLKDYIEIRFDKEVSLEK